MKFEFNSSDFLQAFRGDVSRFGLIPTDSIEPGRLFRCRAEGKKTGYPGWGIIHLNPDGTAGGTIGIWGGNKQNFFYRNDGNRIGYNDLTPEARVAFQKQMDEARARLKTEIAAKQKKAAGTARRIWEKSRQPDQEHLYLKAKGIKAHGIRQVGKVLIIPLYSTNGELVSLQRIFPDGGKKYHPGGQVKGCSFLIGDPAKSDIIYISEGFATGASIHEATGQPVAVAFTANNLDAVIDIMKKRHPEKQIIIAADNDLETARKRPDLGNPGKKAAEAAAAAHGVELSICPVDSDFNDLHQVQGLEAVRAALKKTREIDSVSDPIPLPDELSPVMPFDYDLLPERLRPWVQDISERMQCPPDFVAVAVMAAQAAVIGRKVGIRPQARTDWTVVCNLWALIVGRPGVLKSPALEAGLSPLKRLIATANERYQTDIELHETEALAAKMRKEAAEKQARKLLAKDPKADLSTVFAVGEEPVPPVLKRYQANDSTAASLGELLRQNPNGLLVFRDEVVSLLKNLDRDGQDEGRGFYLTAWNGDSPYTFDRIGRGLNLHIPALCISLLGGTQPGRFSEYISHAVKGGAADDGLIQRFGLIVWPDMNGTWVNIDRYPDTEAKNKAFQVFDALDRLDTSKIGAEQDTDFNGDPDGIPYLRFDHASLELFTEWRTALESKLRSDLHPALESHYAKYRKLIPSLALIIHLADGGTGPVSEDATLRALAWGEYLETHAERAYSSVSRQDVSTAKAILHRIKKGDLKTPFTSHAVWRPGWSKLSDRDQVMGGLRMLEDYNHIYTERVETGGRAKTLYHQNEGE
jgi:putative DNA primase/helicase